MVMMAEKEKHVDQTKQCFVICDKLKEKNILLNDFNDHFSQKQSHIFESLTFYVILVLDHLQR